MILSNSFISGTAKFNTYENNINAPLMRRVFIVKSPFKKGEITITALGFYELYINGNKITKGKLAPYISNPNQVLYYDNYDITPYLNTGDNVIGIILGNGMINALDQDVWQFEKASFRAAPMLSLCLEIDGKILLEADDCFKTKPSAILFDDLRMGERYDSRLYECDWNKKDYDDSDWQQTIVVPCPKGEKVLSREHSIKVIQEKSPVSIKKVKGGYVYDFGINSAGFFKLKLKNSLVSQKICLHFTEILVNGIPSDKNITFKSQKKHIQQVIYYARGDKEEVYEPYFSYYGFRYVYVMGIEKSQAQEDLLTYLIASTAHTTKGKFECSDMIANKLQEISLNSNRSNFFNIPTDCPHREKNGWTGDAAVSAEQFLLNHDLAAPLSDWMVSIRNAQRDNGALPGIIPTDGWGFDWGNGPMWDSVIVYIPLEIYRYTGDVSIIADNIDCIYKYIRYLNTRLNNLGLIEIGLGDWCAPRCHHRYPKAPLVVTDSIISLSILDIAVKFFNILKDKDRAEYALNFYNQLKKSIQDNLIDKSTSIVQGNCQTSQALALYFNLFEKEQETLAYKVLIDLIKQNDYHHDCGMIGTRFLYRTLSRYGDADLAYELITKKTFPSYGYMIANGATSLWEKWHKVVGKYRVDSVISYIKISKEKGIANKLKALLKNLDYFYANKFKASWELSYNHHFFGDVSAWFYKSITGININEHITDIYRVDISPNFIKNLNYAKAEHTMSYGKIESEWTRTQTGIHLKISIPKDCIGNIILPHGYAFISGESVMPIKCIDELVILKEDI